MSRHTLGRLRGVLSRAERARSSSGSGEFDARQLVTFVAFGINGRSGVSRTVLNIAGALADTHRVRILSVYGGGPPVFAIDPRIDVEYVVPVAYRQVHTLRKRDAALAAKPSTLVNGARYSELTDAGLRAALGRCSAGDVVVSTGPTLHQMAADLTVDGVIRIGWDHLNYPARQEQGGGGKAIRQAMDGLSAFVVLTDADRSDYLADHPDARIQVIRNALPWEPAAHRPVRDGRTVVAAGRLAAVKGFDRLIDAWASIAEEHPDWECQIHGTGPLQEELQAQIDRCGLSSIRLAGHCDDMSGALRAADVLVLCSRLEGFGMTIIEAFSQGTPVVSFDCPRGPGELVSPDNGRLVPANDVPGLARALAELMASKELRDALGEQALRDSRQYDLARIADEWRALIADLTQ